jgi:hypothetical protein
MLAARARGLGTTWTTLHLLFEEEAAQILGVLYVEVNQAGLIPVAYTQGTHFVRRGELRLRRWFTGRHGRTIDTCARKIKEAGVLILLFVVQIRFKIFEAGHKRGGKIPQRKHLIPFVGRTIRAHLSYAFVAVAGTGKSGTRNIQENAADSTFLFHAFLLGWRRYGSLILATPTKIAKKEAIFYMGVPLRSCSLHWGCVRDACNFSLLGQCPAK